MILSGSQNYIAQNAKDDTKNQNQHAATHDQIEQAKDNASQRYHAEFFDLC